MRNAIIRVLEILVVLLTITMFVTGLIYAQVRTQELLELTATLSVSTVITFVAGLKLSTN